MKNVILCLAVLFVASTGYAQSISGMVRDSRQAPLAGATVRLLNPADSVPLQSVSSDINGRFSLRPLRTGSFLLSIDVVGHMAYFQPVNLDSINKELQLPDITLAPAKAKELSGVIVRSKKPLLEHSVDKTIVNVDAMISAAASNVLEVLARTPGVTVDNQGGISLNGRSGVLVLIEGRQTYMSAQDLAAYLKSLPGSTLDKIELIDNPSAKYDAAGNAIINLQLKKNRTGGLTGSVAAGYTQGAYGRQNYSANLSYHTGKITVFTNAGYNVDRNYFEDVYRRRYYEANGDLSSTVRLRNNQRSKGNSYNFMGGLDYQLSSRTILGFVGNYNRGKRTGLFDYYSETFDPAEELTAKGYGNTIGQDKRNNAGLNLNIQHKFARKGQELSGDVNYLKYRTNGQQELENFLQEQQAPVMPASRFSYQLPSSIRIYTAKADYVQGIGKKGKFEAGAKTSFVKNDNTSDYYDKDGMVPAYEPALSNRFIYRENINALYVNEQHNWGRLSTQIGLRMEHTSITGKQPANAAFADTSFSRSYVNWFPSFMVAYKLDSLGKKILSVVVTRRVNRPSYQMLNPFLFYRDNYSYSGGNPMLNPQIQNRYELKYQHGQLLMLGLSYNDFSGVILPGTITRDSLFITRPTNFARGIMVLLNIGVNVSPAKWWTINSTVRLSRIGLRGTIDSEKLSPNTNVLRWELSNFFTISKKLNAELTSYYASADMNGQNTTDGMYRISAGIQQKLGDKASLRLIMDDIFHSWVYHNRSIGLKQADFIQTNTSDTQRFGMAFTYRFGKAAKNRKRGEADEEKGRAE